MKDAISLPRVRSLHPKIAKEVEDIINHIELSNPFAIRVVQALRTIEEQDALYAQGRTRPGKKVTNAMGGKSYHNYGLAIDFAIMYDKDHNGTYETLSWDLVADIDRDGEKDWQEVVKAFKEKGYSWGGDWKSIKDNPHLEKSFGYSTTQLFALYKQKKFIHSNTYLDI